MSGNSNFYFNIMATVRDTRHRLGGAGALCYLKSVIRGDLRIRQLRGLKLQAVKRSRFAHLGKRGILLQTRKRPPSACRVTQQGGVAVISTAYPIILRLRHGVRGYCITAHSDRARIIVCKGGKRTRMGNLIKRARKATVIVRGMRSLNQLSFDQGVYLFSRAAGSLSKFHRIITRVQQHVTSKMRFRCFSAVYHRITGHLPGVGTFTSGRS